MSLYGTLPRNRNRHHHNHHHPTILSILPPAPPLQLPSSSSDHSSSSFSSSSSSSSSSTFCRSQLAINHTSNDYHQHSNQFTRVPSSNLFSLNDYDDVSIIEKATTDSTHSVPPPPPKRQLSQAYLPNSDYYTPSLISSTSSSSSTNRSTLKPLPLPSIVSLNSLHYPLIGKDRDLSPTEDSDTVTFTESASYDDYSSLSNQATTSTTSSSIIIGTNQQKAHPKVYYATDSLLRPKSSRSRDAQQKKPNFYGIPDEDSLDDDEEEEEDEGIDNSENVDMYRVISCRDLNKYREHRRKQSLSLDSSLFDPSIIGSPLSSLAESSNSVSKSMHQTRFGYRLKCRLSMRIKKLYDKSTILPSFSSKSSDSLNSVPTLGSKKSPANIQIRLRQLFSQQPSGSHHRFSSTFTNLSIGSLWKNKIVVVFNKAFSHSSLNSLGLRSRANKSCDKDDEDDFDDGRDSGGHFVRTGSIAGIKKRPLSMTYDLDRVNDQTRYPDKAHMVAAFEQSLSSMTTRLQQLSSSSELKDCELDRLRKTIETLRQQGGNLVSGVKNGHRSTLPAGIRKGFASDTDESSNTYSKYQQHQLSSESVNSVSSCGEPSKGKKKSRLKSLTGQNTSWIRSSFSRAFKKKSKHPDSASGQNGGREIMSDAESGNESSAGRRSANGPDNSTRSVPSSPLMSIRSFKTSSSSESRDPSKSEELAGPQAPESVKDLQKQLRSKEMQLTDMRLESLTSAHQLENLKEMLNQMRLEMTTLKQDNDRLQRMVNHKSLASSVSSLATSTHVAPISHDPSGSPSAANGTANNVGNGSNIDANSLESVEIDGLSSCGSANNDSSPGQQSSLKPVSLGSGSHTMATFGITSKTNWDQLDSIVKRLFKEHLIRVDCSLSLGITVDSLACYRVGAEQVQRNFQCAMAQDAGIQQQQQQQNTPELLPFGYLVEESHINLQFKTTLDSLAFDTLTPKSILSQFLALLSENKRLILAGPSGTGKTYLAHKLAEYLVIQQQLAAPLSEVQHGGQPITAGAIATFNVDHKNAKELRAYLSNIAEQCESLSNMVGDAPRSPLAGPGLPIVIILDNLHHIDDSLVVDIFNDLYRLNTSKSPYILGTINQNMTNAAIGEMFRRFQFRMATFSVHTEPVKGFLTRYLRRKWLEAEAKLGNKSNQPDAQLGRIVEWMPKVCLYLNRFLESFFPQQNVSIGPRLFTSCPIDLNGSQIWFTDLWNFSILPFITENLRDLLAKSSRTCSSTTPSITAQQIYARLKDKFVDPTEWIIENYPWSSNGNGSTSEWSDHLNRLALEDILDKSDGQEQMNAPRCGSSASGKLSATGKPPVPTSAASMNQQIDKVNDPFLEMLLKLKEASEMGNNSNSSQQDDANK